LIHSLQAEGALGALPVLGGGSSSYWRQDKGASRYLGTTTGAGNSSTELEGFFMIKGRVISRLGRPEGWAARLVGWIMARSNLERKL